MSLMSFKVGLEGYYFQDNERRRFEVHTYDKTKDGFVLFGLYSPLLLLVIQLVEVEGYYRFCSDYIWIINNASSIYNNYSTISYIARSESCS